MSWWTDAPRTLAEIEAVPGEILLCKDVARVLCSNPSTIREQAKKAPEKLRFPVIVVGERVKIPKRPFLKFMNGDEK